jgi:cytochrome P450 family 110
MHALPPGPSSGLLTALAYLRDPYGSLQRTARRYGDPFSWPTALGTMAVTADPGGVRTLMSAPADTFSALGAELLVPVLGASNLILMSGERHRAMRKLQAPSFQGARLRAWGQLILEVTDRHIERLPRGRPFSAHRATQEIALDVILQVALGLADPERRATFRAAVLGLLGALKPSFMFFPGLRRPLAGLSAWARFQRAGARMTALYEEEMRLRRAESTPREDILGLLMAARHQDGSPLSDEEVGQQLMSTIGAGHETTASALAWALHHVYRDGRVKRRCDEELATLPPGRLDPDAVSALPYLEAVCHETLRLDPVAPIIGRTLREGLTLQGFELPAGISVGVAIVNVHRRADLYPDPERFAPERFLERTFTGFEYLPFGGGARRCLGAALALYEMKLVLASLLRARGLQLMGGAPVRAVLRNTTVGPSGGVEMRLHA